MADNLFSIHSLTDRKWILRRKIINPAFYFRTLEQFVHIFDKHSRRLVKAIEQLQVNNQIELYPLFSLTALDIICGKLYFVVPDKFDDYSNKNASTNLSITLVSKFDAIDLNKNRKPDAVVWYF